MTSTYLYLLNLSGTDLYKIGISARPYKRLEQVTDGKHSVVIVRVWPELACYEKRLHSRYGHRRVRENLEALPASGRTEWFRLTSEEVAAVLADCHCERLRVQELGRLRQRARCAE